MTAFFAVGIAAALARAGADPALRAGAAAGAGAENETAAAVAAAAQEAPVMAAAATGVPFWCHLVPPSLRSGRCSQDDDRAPAAPGPDCSRLSADDQAHTAACAYSQHEALQFAYLSSAAFCDGSLLESWSCGTICERVGHGGVSDVRHIDADDLDAHAYVGHWRGQCLLAFRGTDSFDGWVQDLKSTSLDYFPGCSSPDGSPCRVGSGFLENYQAVSAGIRAALLEIGCDQSKPLAITGHSLGAALATLALFDFRRLGYTVAKSYNFGSPRVGDDAFASAFNAAFTKLPFFRLTRADDPVVYLPRPDPFHHVGTEVFYRGGTFRGHRVCDGSGEDQACAGQVDDGELAGLLLDCLVHSHCGHLKYLEPVARPFLMGNGCHSGSPHSEKAVLP